MATLQANDEYLIHQKTRRSLHELITNIGRCLIKCRSWRCPRNGQLHHGQSFISSISMPLEGTQKNENTLRLNTTNKWSKVPDAETVLFLQNLVQETADETCDTDFEDPPKSVADLIHGLADSLPDTGYYVDILWILNDRQVPEISQHVSLYGALKRMIEWHHGHITFVNSSDDNGQLAASPWAKFLHPTLKTTTDNLLEEFVWRGRVNVTEQKTMSSYTLPGFVLRSAADKEDDNYTSLMSKLFPKSPSPKRSQSVRKTKQEKAAPKESLCLSSRMEFLEEIPFCHVPSFFITSKQLELSLLETGLNSNSEELTKSEVLYDHILKNKKMCSFMRLWFSTSQPKVTKPSMKKKDSDEKEKTGTEIWQDKLLQNEITMPEQPLTGPMDYYTFLIRPNESGKLSAYLCRQPQEINGGIIEVLMKCPGPIAIDQNHIQNAQKLLKQLPSVAPDLLTQMNDKIYELQTTILRTWIDEQEAKGEAANLSEDQLYSMLTKVRETYITKVQEKADLKPTKLKDVSHLTFVAPTSELDIDPSEWLERYALTERENTEKMQRIKSMDRIGGVPPPPKEKEDEAFKLDAAQFLKMFAPTGAPIAECLSPIRLPNAKSRLKLPKYNSGEVKDSVWPECTKYNYHGIYYNSTFESEQLEARYGRIRDRYICHETSSTCTLQQKTKPTTVGMLTCFSSKPRDKNDAKIHVLRKGSSDDFTKERRTGLKRSATNKASDVPPGDTKKRKSPRLTKTNDTNKTAKSDDHAQKDKPKTTKVEGKADDKGTIMSRSERHKRKLLSIVEDVLVTNGMPKDNPAYKTCSDKLYKLTKMFVMDLKSSWNLSTEMRKIAEEQVRIVIEFELKKRRTVKS